MKFPFEKLYSLEIDHFESIRAISFYFNFTIFEILGTMQSLREPTNLNIFSRQSQ